MTPQEIYKKGYAVPAYSIGVIYTKREGKTFLLEGKEVHYKGRRHKVTSDVETHDIGEGFRVVKASDFLR